MPLPARFRNATTLVVVVGSLNLCFTRMVGEDVRWGRAGRPLDTRAGTPAQEYAGRSRPSAGGAFRQSTGSDLAGRGNYRRP
jgi:hypothetical protein